jgi:hypothetical protein
MTSAKEAIKFRERQVKEKREGKERKGKEKLYPFPLFSHHWR